MSQSCRCFRPGTVLLFLAAVVWVPWAPAADEKAPATDVTKLEGKTLHRVNPDDARLLGVIARGLINQAQLGDRLTPEQTNLSLLAIKAYRDRDFDSAYRYAVRFILLRRGQEINEGTELAASYDV